MGTVMPFNDILFQKQFFHYLFHEALLFLVKIISLTNLSEAFIAVVFREFMK